jgi:hypothetical protein
MLKIEVNGKGCGILLEELPDGDDVAVSGSWSDFIHEVRERRLK